MSFFPVHPAEPIQRALEAFRSQIHTAMPAVCVSYARASQTGQFRPAIRMPIASAADDDVDEYEALPDVYAPVVWPRGAGGFVHTGLEAGDGVLLIFAQADFEAYRNSGQAGDPADNRTFSMSHGWAIPGCFPRSDALPDLSTDLEIGSETGPRVRVSSSGLGLDVDPGALLGADHVAAAERVNAFLQALKAQCVSNPGPLTGSLLGTMLGGAETAMVTLLSASTPVPPGAFGTSRVRVPR